MNRTLLLIFALALVVAFAAIAVDAQWGGLGVAYRAGRALHRGWRRRHGGWHGGHHGGYHGGRWRRGPWGRRWG